MSVAGGAAAEKEVDLTQPQTEVALINRGLTELPKNFVSVQAATLKKLDLSENKITSGTSLAGLKSLSVLILDKNELTALSDFPTLSSLDTLWLNNNGFKDLKTAMDQIEKSFPNLTYLSMLKNPCVPNLYFSEGEYEAYQRYRYYVIHRLKKLKGLDATPIDAAERKEADRVGKHSIVSKPVTTKEEDDRPVQKAKPPIKASNKPPKVATFLGKGKPRYDGSNSEGNRFISNDELVMAFNTSSNTAAMTYLSFRVGETRKAEGKSDAAALLASRQQLLFAAHAAQIATTKAIAMAASTAAPAATTAASANGGEFYLRCDEAMARSALTDVAATLPVTARLNPTLQALIKERTAKRMQFASAASNDSKQPRPAFGIDQLRASPLHSHLFSLRPAIDPLSAFPYVAVPIIVQPAAAASAASAATAATTSAAAAGAATAATAATAAVSSSTSTFAPSFTPAPNASVKRKRDDDFDFPPPNQQQPRAVPSHAQGRTSFGTSAGNFPPQTAAATAAAAAATAPPDRLSFNHFRSAPANSSSSTAAAAPYRPAANARPQIESDDIETGFMDDDEPTDQPPASRFTSSRGGGGGRNQSHRGGPSSADASGSSGGSWRGGYGAKRGRGGFGRGFGGRDDDDDDDRSDRVPRRVEKKSEPDGFITGSHKHTLDELQKGRSGGSVASGGRVGAAAPAGLSSSSGAKSLGGKGRGYVAPKPIASAVPSNAPAMLKKALEPSKKEEEVDERLAKYDPKLVASIRAEVIDRSDVNVAWDDIAGLHLAKDVIHESIIFPLTRPDLYTGLTAAPRGILLFGPPGTGKTMIGKAIAKQAKAKFFSLSASTLTSKWHGEGEKLVSTLFAVAQVEQPSVIFIDEIDALLCARTDGEFEASRRMKTQFLIELDGIKNKPSELVVLVCATNRPQNLDDAARRRLTKRLYIPLPDRGGRLTLIRTLLEKHRATGKKVDLKESDVETICDKMDGYSGADIDSACREAAMFPLRRLQAQSHARGVDMKDVATSDLPALDLGDFMKALKAVKRTVTPGSLHEVEEWNKQFGTSSTVSPTGSPASSPRLKPTDSTAPALPAAATVALS